MLITILNAQNFKADGTKKVGCVFYDFYCSKY